MNEQQNITRSSLGKREAWFLTQLGPRGLFSTTEARAVLGPQAKDATTQFLDRLVRKGWLRRIRRGRFAVIPLSSGETRTPQLHEYVIAMQLVSPAAIAYWSALNYHGLTEQLPRTVYVATNHPVHPSRREALGIAFQVVAVRPAKWFGLTQQWVEEQPVYVTDREKTLIDGLDLPQYVGGVGEIAKALKNAWRELDEAQLRDYARRIGNSAVAKRLGFLMEQLQLGDPEALRHAVALAPGFSPLDPTLPKVGQYQRR